MCLKRFQETSIKVIACSSGSNLIKKKTKLIQKYCLIIILDCTFYFIDYIFEKLKYTYFLFPT